MNGGSAAADSALDVEHPAGRRQKRATAVVDVAYDIQRAATGRLQKAVVDDCVAADVDRQAVGRGVVGIDDTGRLVDQVQPIVAAADAAGAADSAPIIKCRARCSGGDL